MSETKFTPGPWSVSNTPEGSEFEVFDSKGGYICYICGVAFDAEGPSPSEALADARLIAAAPDMFDALVQAENRLHALGDYLHSPARAAALAALAKARGETA